MKSFSDNENEEVISEINVTPLVDVMLILMIIFLITAPLLIKNIDVQLPNAAGASESKNVSKTIVIKENGDLLFDGKEISIENLGNALSKLSKEDVLIKIAADKNSHYQDVAEILSLLGKKQITNVSFLMQN